MALPTDHAVVGRERLVVLFRWLRREQPADAEFVDAVSGNRVDNPMAIDWSLFPLQEAIDAIPLLRSTESSSR